MKLVVIEMFRCNFSFSNSILHLKHFPFGCVMLNMLKRAFRSMFIAISASCAYLWAILSPVGSVESPAYSREFPPSLVLVPGGFSRTAPSQPIRLACFFASKQLQCAS